MARHQNIQNDTKIIWKLYLIEQSIRKCLKTLYTTKKKLKLDSLSLGKSFHKKFSILIKHIIYNYVNQGVIFHDFCSTILPYSNGWCCVLKSYCVSSCRVFMYLSVHCVPKVFACVVCQRCLLHSMCLC